MEHMRFTKALDGHFIPGDNQIHRRSEGIWRDSGTCNFQIIDQWQVNSTTCVAGGNLLRIGWPTTFDLIGIALRVVRLT